MTLVLVLAVLAVLALGYGILVLSRLYRARPRSASPDSPARPRDDVRFTVYRPACVEPERWYELLVYAHRAEGPTEDGGWQPDLSAEVRGEASRLLGDAATAYRTATEDAAQPVVRDSQLEFVPEIDGFQFNPPRIVLDWTEDLHRAHFRMRADTTLLGTTARGQLTIFNGPIILAQLALVIRVAGTAAEEAPERSVVTPYRRVFASYSHTDAAVVQRVAEYARALGDEYLVDVTHIRAGEKWEPRIEQLITQADVFQLFWSWNAIGSDYVQREWRYALSLGRPNFVRPVYWEDPLPQAPDRGLPPPELRAVHFQRVALAAQSKGGQGAAAPEFRDVRLEDAYPPSSEFPLRPQPAPHAEAPHAPGPAAPPRPRRTRLFPLAATAMVALVAGVIGYQALLMGGGAAPPDATTPDETDVPATIAPPPPPPPSPEPPAFPAQRIMVAAFRAPADDAALTGLAEELRAYLVATWTGSRMVRAPADRDLLEAATAAGSRFVVSAALSRAEGQIRINAGVTDLSSGFSEPARSVAVPDGTPAPEIAALLRDALREVLPR